MKIIIAFTCCLIYFTGFAQLKDRNDSAAARHEIDSVNRLLDMAVVNKQLNILNKHYADDFYFKHSTGLIDSKKSWIENIMKAATNYTSRTHDSIKVELHKDIAILTGTLTVNRVAEGKTLRYALNYFRIYVLRNKVWQLLSHNSIKEWDL